jgi:erythromycin esterase
MPQAAPVYPTLDEWIAREAIRFSLAPDDAFNAAVDRMVVSLSESVQLLGFGEPMHGAEEFLLLRNRFFQRLVDKHGYSAIAIESSFPRGRVADEFVAGERNNSFEAIADAGFSHGFGSSPANRQLIEWMRQHNADGPDRTKVRFYGFDSPTEMMGADSPRQLLQVVLDYLEPVDRELAQVSRQRIEALLGNDADWVNPEAAFDPSKSIGLSPAATSLRVETEDLIAELQRRRPELIAQTGRERFAEAIHHASHARQMSTYHAEMAHSSPTRTADLLGLRDLMMADNLAYIMARERPRGKVLAFAHNSHLKYGQAVWQWGPSRLVWWPAGAQVREMLGAEYAVIGTGVGISNQHGIRQPEPGALEALLTATQSPATFVPTRQGRMLSPTAAAALPARTGGTNQSYFPFTPKSVNEFDALLVFGSIP